MTAKTDSIFLALFNIVVLPNPFVPVAIGILREKLTEPEWKPLATMDSLVNL